MGDPHYLICLLSLKTGLLILAVLRPTTRNTTRSILKRKNRKLMLPGMDFIKRCNLNQWTKSGSKFDPDIRAFLVNLLHLPSSYVWSPKIPGKTILYTLHRAIMYTSSGNRKDLYRLGQCLSNLTFTYRWCNLMKNLFNWTKLD